VFVKFQLGSRWIRNFSLGYLVKMCIFIGCNALMRSLANSSYRFYTTVIAFYIHYVIILPVSIYYAFLIILYHIIISLSSSCYITVVLIASSIACSTTRQYLSYSKADFEVFHPAGATRCTDGEDQRSPPPYQISPHWCNG